MYKSLKQELESIFRDIVVTEEADRRLTVVAGAPQVPTILRLLKERGFDHLTLLSTVDRIEDWELELVYVLTSYSKDAGPEAVTGDKSLILKASIPRDNPRHKTAIGVFPNIEPYEREIHELFGIHFEGHPRLTPLFLERRYPIPPFRKDFDTREYVEHTFGKIPFVDEEKG